MGNGSNVLQSKKVTDIYHRILALKPAYRHYTVHNHFLVAVVGDPVTILGYDFGRSSKPLFRVVDGGQTIILREWYHLGEALNLLRQVEGICDGHNKNKKGGQTSPAVASKEDDHPYGKRIADQVKTRLSALGQRPGPTIGLCPDGKVVLRTPSRDIPVELPVEG